MHYIRSRNILYFIVIIALAHYNLALYILLHSMYIQKALKDYYLLLKMPIC